MRSVVAVLLGACSFSGGGNPAIDAGGDGDGDGDGDGGIDAMPVECAVWGPRRFFDACDMAAIFENPVSRPGIAATGLYTFDTSTGELTPPEGGATTVGSPQTITGAAGNAVDVHLVVVEGFRVPAGVTIRVIGDRPLVIAATRDIEIDGDIDLSARFGDGAILPAGSGAQGDGACSDLLDGSDDDNGGSGGAGGAMAFGGGGGGLSSSGAIESPTGGVPHFADVDTAALHGGCPGGRGGKGDRGVGGAGGSGGGALVLSSVTAVIVDGTIQANGSEGRGQIDTTDPDDRRNGGGGAGSGGLIALEGPVVTIDANAVIVTNGGGGGGGANNSLASTLHGEAGRLDTDRAAGGVGEQNADGGRGGARGPGGMIADFAGAVGEDSDDRGGGGGGGSAGSVFVIAPGAGFGQAGLVSPVVTLRDPPSS